MGTPRLEASGLVKRFRHPDGTVQALDGVDLQLGDGEFVSLIGPSGCGKSTLFSILAGLEGPSAGEIRLDGRLVTPEELLGHVGYMPQKDLLMPWRTIVDNATVGLEVAGTSRAVARARALELFPRFGLEGFDRRYPIELSGGMRQRAALLRTFLAGREVNLLDEPFGALDSLTRAGMQQWLLDVWEGLRKTILFVTHDVDEALFLSDRVLVMSPRPGRIAHVLEVDLPRPRPYNVVTSEGFVALKRLLVEQLNLGHGAAGPDNAARVDDRGGGAVASASGADVAASAEAAR